ncbi:hypothetical protein KC19_10G035100 [Ceratodon purpureus]|uniref:Uncharacterized protein n=1 Tax=Ceratodon purpureus TaxID=3225 RepID=A0A8T0GK17_CERPU|nr:hypothetical protein KC19_10G035100 [Ceratodon purpureus]
MEVSAAHASHEAPKCKDIMLIILMIHINIISNLTGILLRNGNYTCKHSALRNQHPRTKHHLTKCVTQISISHISVYKAKRSSLTSTSYSKLNCKCPQTKDVPS